MHGEEALVAFKVKVGSFKASVAALFKGLKEVFLPFLRSTDVNSLLVNYKGNRILSQMTHRIDQKRAMRIV